MGFERTERQFIGQHNPNFRACHLLCSIARRVGNCAVFTMRQDLFSKVGVKSRTKLDQHIRNAYPSDYRAMPSAASAQRQTQIVHEQFKSFFAAKAEYDLNSEKFTGKPKLPGYQKKYRTFVVGRNGYKIENGFLTISGAERYGLNPIKVLCCQNQLFNAKKEVAVCKDLRIVPTNHGFFIELTYRKEKQNSAVLLDKNYALAVDLGVDNLASCIATKPGVAPLLVKGRTLKSINQGWNKRHAALQEGIMKAIEGRTDERENEYTKIKRLYKHCNPIAFHRNMQIDDLLHKASRVIVNYCLAHDLGTIIIGLNKQWKQRVNIGKINNQKFVQIPHSKLVDLIKYKAEELGIEVIVREESYTSKASALDFDPMPEKYQEGLKCRFSGKRVKRGLYRTKNGRLFSADLNGALNIARKELGDEWLHKLLKLDEGVVDMPVVIRCLHNKADSGILLEAGIRPCETAYVSKW